MDEKPIKRIANSYKDLTVLPHDVRRLFGYALSLAQAGKRHADAKVLKGFGNAGVLEVIENHEGGTYRAVYTIRFEEAVFVLHWQADADIIRERLKRAATRAKWRLATRLLRLSPAKNTASQPYGKPKYGNTILHRMD